MSVVVVTGGTAGIGLAACRALASQGHTVVMTGRDVARAEAVRARVAAEASNAGVHLLALDLESFRSVRSFAAELRARFPRVHALVHNAGAVYPKRKLTEDGNEAQLQVIQLGPFLLNQLLLDVIKASAPSRIVNVVSDLHKNAGALDDWDSERTWGPLGMVGSVRSYARAELFKVCTTYALARRLAGSGVDVNCVHPGGVRTNLFRNFRGPMGWLLWLSDLLKKSPSSGARGLVHLASAAEVTAVSGAYFVGEKQKSSSAASLDEHLQERVWQESERRVLR